MTAQSQIYKAQRDMGYDTTLEYANAPQWQARYSKYGGIRKYETVVKKFWREAGAYLHKPNTSNVLFEFHPKPEDLVNFNHFRNDLSMQLDLPTHLIEKYQK